jgi:uncharacterized protein (DUF983 family)
MLGKGSKLYSILAMKCPRCHEGALFETGAYSFKKPFEMRPSCSKCQLNYEPEPGFYYGAMFISYILTAFFAVGFVGYLRWGLKWDLLDAFGMLILIFGINYVWIFRVSRAVWINIVVGYQKLN